MQTKDELATLPAFVSHFKENGWCVVPVFSETEVDDIRRDLHSYLLQFGVRHGEKTNKCKNLPTGNTHHLDVFYSAFKTRFSLDKRVWKTMSSLWQHTFSSGCSEHFEHNFGEFDAQQGFVHFDRVCYRPADSGKKRSSGALKLHIDCNPNIPPRYAKIWRPVQMSLALVDHDGSGTDGGLGVVSGFHKEFDNYFQEHPISRTDTEFNILKRSEHQELWKRIEFIRHPAGSIVMWDNRLPHCTAPENHRSLGDAREVLFSSFLPAVGRNNEYARQQMRAFRANRYPPYFITAKNAEKTLDRSQEIEAYQFDATQRKLLTIEPWQ